MLKLLKQIRNVSVKFLEGLLILSFVVLTLNVLWGVFSRYVLGAQSIWTEELAIYLLVWVSLIGAAVTYEEHGHLGVDYFVGKMDPDAQHLTAIFVEIMVLFFSVGILMLGGSILVHRTLEAGQIAPAMNIPVGYLYLAAPISGVFFTLFCLEHLGELLTGERPTMEKGEVKPVE